MFRGFLPFFDVLTYLYRDLIYLRMKEHVYDIKVEWTGSLGEGTRNYKSYTRDHSIFGKEKYNEILGSSDPAFLGDKARYNPEDLFLSSISSCHMLWYLHLCSVHNIVVKAYSDDAQGFMSEEKSGKGQFTSVILNPKVVLSDSSKKEEAIALHEEANQMCFIANSCNFKIEHKVTIE